MVISIISTVFLVFGIIFTIGFLLILIEEFRRTDNFNAFKIVYTLFGATIVTFYLFGGWHQHYGIKEDIKTVQELPTSEEGYKKYSAIKFDNTLSFYGVFDKELKALFEKNDKRFEPYLIKENNEISKGIAKGIENSNIVLICCTIIIVSVVLSVASSRKVS